MDVEVRPTGDTAAYSSLKKDQCDREAAGHPLPVLVDPSFKNEGHWL